MNNNLGSDYLEHEVFDRLRQIAKFYESLSTSILSFIAQGVHALNIDTYVYSSIKETINSVYEILQKGRINDSYALLRKYYDSTIVNVYSNLYIDDNFSFENMIVDQIENWRKGVSAIPGYGKMSQYIRASPKMLEITRLLEDDRYRLIKDRCNDHVHYNFYSTLLYNDPQLFLKDRVGKLDIFLADLDDIFIQHFAYLFYLNEHYMVSSDFMDSIEAGMEPDRNLQYEVAPFIQDTFESLIKIKRPDIAEAMKFKINMYLK